MSTYHLPSLRKSSANRIFFRFCSRNPERKLYRLTTETIAHVIVLMPNRHTPVKV